MKSEHFCTYVILYLLYHFSLQEAFAKLDLDGDGRLSRKEVEKAMSLQKNKSTRKQSRLRKKKKELLKKQEEVEKEQFDLQRLSQKWFKSEAAKQLKDMTFLLRMACLA